MNHDRSEDREWKARRMRSGGKRKKTLETVREREREGEREREQRNETKAKASWSSSEREKFRVPKKKRKEIWGGLLPFLWLSLSVPLFFFFLSFFLF